MSELDHRNVEDLLRLTRLPGVDPVRDVGLLEAAGARPRASVLGDMACPTLGLKAAALLHALVRNCALVNGDKRLAWLAAVVFLDLNGVKVDLDDDVTFELVVAVPEGDLDLEQIAQRRSVGPRAGSCRARCRGVPARQSNPPALVSG